jgi:hypothetical protein
MPGVLTVDLPQLVHDVVVDVVFFHHELHHLLKTGQFRQRCIIGQPTAEMSQQRKNSTFQYLLNHVLRNPVDLLLWLHVGQWIKVQVSITLQQT